VLVIAALLGCVAEEPGPPPWSWCSPPDALSGRGEAPLRVEEGALTCAMFDRLADWDQAATDKARVWLRAGQVHLADPDADATTTVLPACVEEAPGEVGAVAEGEAEASWAEAGDLRILTVEQPLDDGAHLRLQARWDPADGQFVVSGAHVPIEQPVALAVELCDGPCPPEGGRRIDDCAFDAYPRQRHTFTVAGGEVSVELRIASSLFATQPGALWSAQGTLDGVSFVQDDYYDLLYRPAQHHISRDARVRLDPPIGDAAWLEVTGFDPLGSPPPTEVWLLDAAGERLEQRAVTAEQFTTSAP
jgi:hypothetical protein